MKETYFTKENIDNKGNEILELFNRRSIPENINRKAALLILDMQDYFLQPDSHAYVPSADAIVGNIKKLSSTFENMSLPVFYTQHVNTPGQAGMMEEWWDDLLTEDHLKKGLIKGILNSDFILIKKSQYDAFYKTELLKELQSRRITDVVITGVMTHLCCETTARSAFVNGFRVWFMLDATATYNLDFHMNSIKNLNHGFAYPILTKEMIGIIEK